MTTDPFEMLPNELVAKILAGAHHLTGRYHLPLPMRWSVAGVCRRWRNAIECEGALDARFVRYLERVPQGSVGPFLRGRVLLGSAVTSMIESGTPWQSALALTAGIRGCTDSDRAKVIVASDIEGAVDVAWTLAPKDEQINEGEHFDEDERDEYCIHGDRNALSSHCILLQTAAHVGAHRSVRDLIRGRRFSSCIGAALIGAVESDLGATAAAILDEYDSIPARYVKKAWREVPTDADGGMRIARLFLDKERRFAPQYSSSTSSDENPWADGRLQSGWIARDAQRCDYGMTAMWRDLGVPYDAVALFAVALCHGNVKFCQGLLDREPSEVANRARLSVAGAIQKGNVGVGSICWLAEQAWFVPPPDGVRRLTSKVCAIDVWHEWGPMSVMSAMVALITRWPTDVLDSMGDGRAIDRTLDRCHDHEHVSCAVALVEALDACRAQGHPVAIAIGPIDLWARALTRLARAHADLERALSLDNVRIWKEPMHHNASVRWIDALACVAHASLRDDARPRPTKRARTTKGVYSPRPLCKALVAAIECEGTYNGAAVHEVVARLKSRGLIIPT